MNYFGKKIKWYRHEPTGATCNTLMYGIRLQAGARLAMTYDHSSKYAIELEWVLENRVKDGETTTPLTYFCWEALDFAVTGKDPTEDSLKRWKPIPTP